MWTTVKVSLAALVLALVIGLSGVVGYTIGDTGGGGSTSVGVPNGSSDTNNGGFAVLDEIYKVLQEDFVNPPAVNPDTLQKGAIDGEIKALGDAHTVYIPPEQYKIGIDLITGSFEGIGAQVDVNSATGDIVIVAPFRGSPAEKAGLRPDDVLLAVDRQSTAGWSVTDAVAHIRGPEGSQVTIKVRHSDRTEQEVSITRDTIVTPTVFTRDIKDESGNAVSDLAYIELQQFTDQTVDDMRKELTRISSAGNYKGIILDMRHNPGGGLDSTVAVADMFLDGGIVLTQVDRDGKKTEYDAHPGGEAINLPVAVLVSKGTDSGAEVLSGALRDHGRAKLIGGEQTFGKGSVNILRELTNGGALYVTIARWLTPNGELIEGVGLTPDFLVASSDAETQSGEGPQLYAAINYLHGNLAQSQP